MLEYNRFSCRLFASSCHRLLRLISLTHKETKVDRSGGVDFFYVADTTLKKKCRQKNLFHCKQTPNSVDEARSRGSSVAKQRTVFGAFASFFR